MLRRDSYLNCVETAAFDSRIVVTYHSRLNNEIWFLI